MIAEKTLLVEGPSDIIYFLEALKGLKQQKLIDIDLNDLSIVDAGTSGNYVAMAKLMLSEGREVVALMDGDVAGENIETQLKRACAAEIKKKKLQIFKLPSNKSIEDIFSDIATLKNSVKNIFTNLTNEGARTATTNFNIDTAIPSIAPVAGKTLGRIIDETTMSWFNPAEKLSKLSIALEYENLVQAATSPVVVGETEAKHIQILLNIKGEKSMEVGVFEEVDE